MLTTRGKAFIKQYMQGTAGTFYGAISVGTSGTASVVGDTRLGFEVARVPVDVVAYDFVADKLIIKGTLPAELECSIYEVGVWTNEVNVDAGNQGSRIITTFDQDSEAWDFGTWVTTGQRIGPNQLRLSTAIGATLTSTLTDLALDLSNSSSADLFTFTLNSNNAAGGNAKYRFMTDASNYYEYTVPMTSGYKIVTAAKGSATVVGSPDWQNITQISVTATNTGATTNNMDFDGIRLEDVDTVSPDYGLVARFIPTVPIVKTVGGPLDVEYALAVTA